MVNESDVAAACQEAVEAQLAADAAYDAAVQAAGGDGSARPLHTPEAEVSECLERQADRAWDAYRDVEAEFLHPEQSAAGRAYLEALDHELGPDSETEAEAG